MIDQRLISYFILAQEKNYTKTASILNLTQPAISQHIKSLEVEYHQKLLIKKGKDIVITPAGEILLSYCKKIMSLDKKFTEEISNIQSNKKLLDIGITLTAGEYLIPSLLDLVIKQVPNISINFHTDVQNKIYADIRNDEYDFAIVEGVKTNEANILEYLLAKDEMVLVVSPEHVFRKYKEITTEMLKKEKLILRHKKSNTRELLENYLAKTHDSIYNYNIMLELENITLIKELVSKNYGVSILPRTVCDYELKTSKLIEIKIRDFSIQRGIYLVYKNNTKWLNLIELIKKEITIK